MKRILLILAVASVMLFSPSGVCMAENLFEVKMGGEIHLRPQSDGKLDMSVRPSPKDQVKNPEFSGTITPKTKIIIIGNKVDKKNLILLNGKRVVVYGKFLKIGQGQRARAVCLYLLLYVQPPTS